MVTIKDILDFGCVDEFRTCCCSVFYEKANECSKDRNKNAANGQTGNFE
jgi:hypothetical protein